ncbi:MAG: MarC-family protein [Chlamydiales bacterium]|jgi:multiple antibiotic resistance protein|nr:MarC-family protein [Chlamydiales bacterium]
MTFLSLAMVFLLIIDPIGNLQAFDQLMQRVPSTERTRLFLREMLIGLLTILAFNFTGRTLVESLGISDVTICLASGIILFLMAVNILYPKARCILPTTEGIPFIVPIAIPMVARPALLATVMLFSGLEAPVLKITLAILLAWAIAATLFWFSAPIARRLGSNGLSALERLMGMLLIMLAIQRFLEGILMFSQQMV